MNVPQKKEITIRELVDGYVNHDEEGVYGYGGRLNIRPKYQREFIYNKPQQQEVIKTIKGGFPLNIMYWVENEDGTFEMLDGQQRTLSICTYIKHGANLSVDGVYFHNLQDDEKERILNYKLTVYFCKGTPSEILAWFRVINVKGKDLTEQEKRNAAFPGSWCTDARRYFSRVNCQAKNIGEKYFSCKIIRQELLELVLKWISGNDVEEYMKIHQHDDDAHELWQYFNNVIQWIERTFLVYRKELMRSVDWGTLYQQFKDADLSPEELEAEISALIADDDVTNKKGVYAYVLTRQEKWLNIRTFSQSMKLAAYERQHGICPVCKKTFSFEKMDGDHITPWSAGGKTNSDNCQMLCKDCNRKKSNYYQPE